MYVIQPAHPWWSGKNWKDARPLPEGFRYGSDSNPHWLTAEELQELIESRSSGRGQAAGGRTLAASAGLNPESRR